ncbi:MAG: CoA transferase [Gammaproteobacteria bacterium]|jgi:crotonobetainyl-CoA:carnitine CoA-transferase CaiB-like acyl-CoA transferase|nr:CoA transferase [Gammaproteobacteria bacterium]MBT4492416.1 CoA transferase [Gammaproteobacteria bacterium]MBT7369311.1 CoA transferase [Gammaproteobacteria bacterium]
MPNTLTGVRVIELGSGPVTGIAGMVLADFGAEVLRIEDPAGDRLGDLPAAPMWQRGKKRVVLDLQLEADRQKLNELCAGADVLLSNLRLSALERKGLDPGSVREQHPHLIYCHISGFGNRGPLADLPGYEHVVAAYAGRMKQFTGIVDREGPVLSAVQVGIHAAAQSAVSGILAALLQRGEKGTGRLVETSLLQGMLPYEMGSMIGHQFFDQLGDLKPLLQLTEEPPLPSLYYHPAQAGDGAWMQFGNLLPHLFDNFLIATELVDVLADPAFDPEQMLLFPEEKHEAFRQRMLERIQERSAAEWMDTFVEDGGIVATAYRTTQQALSDPDIVPNGHVIKKEGGGLQLGPLARLIETPAVPGGNLEPGEALANNWIQTPRPRPTETTNKDLPLRGIRVVEVATIIAAPLAASFLSDMGADVIKVEQIGGDPYRSLLGGLGAARVNVGKRSISVNLKTDEGRQLVHELLASADVLIHNYRPGVAERLGIGYDQIHDQNPGLIYLQSNGYGPDGPGALRPSTHPIPGAAMGGVMYQMGERLPEDLQSFEGLRRWTSRLMRANELNPDPNTALVITTAILLGLSARQRTGQGQRILVDMFGANAYANADDFLSYPGKAPRIMPDEKLLGLSATYRLYPCKDGHWVFLALTCEKERETFCGVLEREGIEVPSSAHLRSNGSETIAELESLFAGRDADDWQNLLAPDGVACVRADGLIPAEFWLKDKQVTAMELTQRATHPKFGSYVRHGPLVQFDEQMPELSGPPLAGSDNKTVLGEFGYDSERVDELVRTGVLWQE